MRTPTCPVHAGIRLKDGYCYRCQKTYPTKETVVQTKSKAAS